MTTKTKFTPCVITSREAMETAVAQIVRLKLEVAQRTVAMELEIDGVQKRHQAWFLELTQQIETQEAGVFVYCQQNKRMLFPEKKSLDLLMATVGFRTEPPSVEKAGKDTWGTIAKRLAALDWGQHYVTNPVPEVDKKALLADRSKLTIEQLDQAGIRFEADEIFYISPKSEVAEKSVQQAA